MLTEFTFYVEKDESSKKKESYARLKKVIQEEFFDTFQFDGMEVYCEPNVKNLKMKRCEEGIFATAKLDIVCESPVSPTILKDAIKEFVDVFQMKYTLEAEPLSVYRIKVDCVEKECKPGYSKVDTRCLKNCKPGYSRDSTRRCKKNKKI